MASPIRYPFPPNEIYCGVSSRGECRCLGWFPFHLGASIVSCKPHSARFSPWHPCMWALAASLLSKAAGWSFHQLWPSASFVFHCSASSHYYSGVCKFGLKRSGWPTVPRFKGCFDQFKLSICWSQGGSLKEKDPWLSLISNYPKWGMWPRGCSFLSSTTFLKRKA